jgi:hypothetical protein
MQQVPHVLTPLFRNNKRGEARTGAAAYSASSWQVLLLQQAVTDEYMLHASCSEGDGNTPTLSERTRVVRNLSHDLKGVHIDLWVGACR